jgi:hypothetical protein
MSINKLQLKRSAVVGKIPTTASLDLGELAINTIDGKIYFKQQDSGSIQRILELTSTSGSHLSASYAQTASYSDRFIVGGTLTAQTLVVQTISSSIIYSSGSNTFGNSLANNQIFTGSVSITGSLTVNGRNYLTDSSSFSTRTLNLEQTSASVLLATASLYAATASLYLVTASYKASSGSYTTTSSFQGYTSSINTYTSSLNAATASIYLATASLYNFSASINAYTASNNATVLDIQKATASLYAATASLYAATASLNITTASLYNFSASINSYTSSNNATVLDIQRATASLYNASASLYRATASLYAASASINSFSASILNFTSSQLVLNGKYATTGSNTFTGTQTITGSNGRLIYTGTTPGVLPTLAEIHANNDYPWLHRFYNDTFSTSSAVMAYYGHNDGRFVFHNESTQSIGLQVNGFNAENGLLVYSNKVAFVNNIEVSGSVNVYGGGFNVDGVNVLDTALAYAIALG